MKFKQLFMEKWTGGLADYRDHRKLLHRLESGYVDEVYWTQHSTRRAQEMVSAGFRWDHMVKAITEPETVKWSDTYKKPQGRYGDVTVPLILTNKGRVVAVTVLPSNRDAWQKLYRSGEMGDRELRSDFGISHKKARIDPHDGLRCSSCLTEFGDAELDSARMTPTGCLCVHCYKLAKAPEWARTNRLTP